MAKKQTRRSISVRGTTYVRLRDYCAGKAISMSDFVEQRIAEFFGDAPEAARSMKTPLKAMARPIVARAPEPRPAPLRAVESAPRAVMPIRAVPARSFVAAKKRAPAPALRATAAPSPLKPPTASGPSGAGRPAPTPARHVLKVRQAVAGRDDYRAIRF